MFFTNIGICWALDEQLMFSAKGENSWHAVTSVIDLHLSKQNYGFQMCWGRKRWDTRRKRKVIRSSRYRQLVSLVFWHPVVSLAQHGFGQASQWSSQIVRWWSYCQMQYETRYLFCMNLFWSWNTFETRQEIQRKNCSTFLVLRPEEGHQPSSLSRRCACRCIELRHRARRVLRFGLLFRPGPQKSAELRKFWKKKEETTFVKVSNYPIPLVIQTIRNLITVWL